MKVYYDKLATYRNAFLIYNPNAGAVRGKPRRIAALQAELQRHGHTITLSATKAPCHATELAQQHVRDGADLLLVAGGDGTINEVVNGIVGSDVPLAVLPCGTANVFAMETRIGGNPMRAARQVALWRPARIAVGLVRNPDSSPRRHFLSMAGAGLDAYVVSTVNPVIKERFGKLAYWLAGFQSVTRVLEEMEINTAGRSQTSSFALMSRVRNYGGDLEIATGASLLRDQFEVVLFEGSNPVRYLKYLSGVAIRRYRGMTGVSVLETHKIALTPRNGSPVQLQVDGELCGELPAIVELIPSALTVLLPPDFLEKERTRWTT